jgi:hypothetical protein
MRSNSFVSSLAYAEVSVPVEQFARSSSGIARRTHPGASRWRSSHCRPPTLNDGKAVTPTTRDHGFREIPSAEFRRLLGRHAARRARVGRWRIEASLKDVAGWQPGARGRGRGLRSSGRSRARFRNVC